MCFLLDSLKFDEQPFAGISNGRFNSQALAPDHILLDQLGKDGVIDWQSVKRIQMFNQLQTHGTSDSSIPKLIQILQEEVQKTVVAESVSAMDEYSGHFVVEVVVLLTEQTYFLVQKFAHELFDVFPVVIGGVLCLLKEVSCWVLHWLHSSLNKFKNNNYRNEIKII